MKNRLLTIALASVCAIGMISCGNPAVPEDFVLTTENVDECIEKIGAYEGLTVTAVKDEVTDSTVKKYADYYYELLAKENNLTDENGAILPMTDETIAALDSKVYKTSNEFMVYIRKMVFSFAEYDYENKIVSEVIKNAADTSEFKEIPKALINREKEYINEQFKEAAENYSIEVDYYLELCGTSVDELSEEYAREEIVLYKIASILGIDDEDTDEMKNAVNKYILSVTSVAK